MNQAPSHMREERRLPDKGATAVLLLSLFFTAFLLEGETSSEIARSGAIGVGLGLAGCFLLEMRRSWRNLFRTDLLALAALYFLTLFEFWFDQTAFDLRVPQHLTGPGTELVLWGFAGIALGRHILLRPSNQLSHLMRQPTPPALIIGVFWTCMALGYLYMLVAVNFNPIAMVDAMFEPRFGRPWGRGRFGNWNALLNEVGLLKYLIPPLAGVVLARRHRYSKWQVFFVVLGLLLTLFYGFSSGTRNRFGIYLATCILGFSFALPRGAWKQALAASGVGAVLLYWATSIMLAFRGAGLRDYIQTGGRSRYLEDSAGIFVDHNLKVISELRAVFPDVHDFLGFEIPYLAIIRPIPRAIWPGKPEGMSMGIEEALGAEGLTLAATFVGEAYMSAGVWGVVLTGLFFGMASSWWTQHLRVTNSDLGILIYASGFFAFAIGMRSMLWATTGILPAIAAIVIGSYLLTWYSAPPQRSRVGTG